MRCITITVKIGSDQAKLITSNNEFALKCYNILKSEDKNLFFSPFSISICLAMLYAGARGATADQMGSTLHFKDQEGLDLSFEWIIKTLNDPSRSQNFKLSIANALWMQEGYNIFPEYLKIVQNSYFGGLFGLDFKSDPEAARSTINNWVAERTEKKIKDLIKPEMVTTLTRLILTNAIYFFSNWEKQFKQWSTSPAFFTMIDGQKVKIPLMNQKEVFIYIEMPDYQALELPYLGNDLSMVIFLPKKIDGIAEMEESMTLESLTSWINPKWYQEVVVSIPKFKFIFEFKLTEILKEMGMIDAFDLDKADFTGITPKNPNPVLNLYISDVIHKTFIDVNEEGTEAAAATAALATLGAAPSEPAPIFKADHPFLFLIRDVKTNSILFLGRIMDPRSEYSPKTDVT
ncbi:MAG: serpin family protein [Candidatus Hodarchaeota archaeon]